MEEKEIYQAVKKIIMDLFGIDEDMISPNKKFREDLCLDSINMVNLQVAVEDDFDIRFDPISTDLAEVFSSVDTLTKFIMLAKKQKVSL
jgi:acyl carrier protein